MDFFVEQIVRASAAEVAKVMFDPDYEDRWIDKAGKAEKLTPGPIAVGSKVRHDAGVLGMRVSFTTEVTAFEPDHLLEMNIIEGPAEGIMIYQVSPTAGGSIASVHVRDHATAPVPRSTWARKEQVHENLERLAHLVPRLRA